MFKTLIILYALSFWAPECTPNPGRSFPHPSMSMIRKHRRLPGPAKQNGVYNGKNNAYNSSQAAFHSAYAPSR